MKNKKFLILFILLLVAYLGSHLWGLVRLPVFSDEAIYIRWAQLIIDNPSEYLFFAMNDGKTPLFIWLLTPFQLIFADKLLAGRVVAVLIGLVQILVVKNIISKLSQSKWTQLYGMLVFSILPFWFFHHRIALMDGLLVLMISLAMDRVIALSIEAKKTGKVNLANAMFSAVFLALAVMTKVPAVLAFPGVLIILLSNLSSGKSRLSAKKLLVVVGGIFGLTVLILLPLLLLPVAPQLFSRGSDFLIPLPRFLSGGYSDTIGNLPNYLVYFTHYLTLPVLIITLAGLFKHPKQKLVHQFFWASVVFALPVALLGLVVYSRYFLPSAWFLSMAFIFATEGLVLKLKTLDKTVRGNSRLVVNLVLLVIGVLVANMVILSNQFLIANILAPEEMPLVKSDSEQYLEKWSAGYGIKETAELVKAETLENRVLVLTEGYFGTLPDGLLMYFYGRDMSRVSIDGIGQPVKEIPKVFVDRLGGFDKLWLVVNADRLEMSVPDELLLIEYCKPHGAPCLQVWDLTPVFE